MSFLDKLKILDRFRFNYTISDDRVGRLAQRKNGKFVLRDKSGNVVTDDFDYISHVIDGKRFMRDDYGRYFSATKSNNNVDITKLNLETAEQPSDKADNCYVVLEPSQVAQIIYKNFDNNQYSRLLFNEETKQISQPLDYVDKCNANNLRIIKSKSSSLYFITSQDGFNSYYTLSSLSEPDQYGVRIGEFIDREKQTSVKVFLPKNYTTEAIYCKDITPLGDGNYVLQSTKDENKDKVIVNSKGESFTYGTFSEVTNMPQFRSIVAMKNSKNGILFSKSPKATKKYKRVNHLTDFDPSLGLFVFKKDAGANLVANVSQSAGFDIDLDVARVLIAIMESKKPSKACFDKILLSGYENASKMLSDGKDAFIKVLNERKTANPELAAECDKAISNLDKISSVLKRKANGYERAIHLNNDDFNAKYNEICKQIEELQLESDQLLLSCIKKENKIQELKGTTKKLIDESEPEKN